VEVKNRIAMTSLRGWLVCPFRFYLRNIVRLESVDPGKTELDAMGFGTLCHAALQAFGNDVAMRDCRDATLIRQFLRSALEREALDVLGAVHTLPLLVQLESARQRLDRVAEVQAQLRAEGWVIQEVEKKISLTTQGLELSGKIDRIDRHEVTGAIRVIDYKTSDKAENPAATHLKRIPSADSPPDFARFQSPDGEKMWIDLQLPLYLAKVAADLPGTEIRAGYFNLPKASTESALAMWDDYTPAHAASAWRCVEGIVAAINAREFWPPREGVRPENDEFAQLFHGGAAQSVAWEGAK
jgi:ATP-dependent helicase/nuclease subunit B